MSLVSLVPMLRCVEAKLQGEQTSHPSPAGLHGRLNWQALAHAAAAQAQVSSVAAVRLLQEAGSCRCATTHCSVRLLATLNRGQESRKLQSN